MAVVSIAGWEERQLEVTTSQPNDWAGWSIKDKLVAALLIWSVVCLVAGALAQYYCSYFCSKRPERQWQPKPWAYNKPPVAWPSPVKEGPRRRL
jgi:hypothetical protein